MNLFADKSPAGRADLEQEIARKVQRLQVLKTELEKVVVGQRKMVHRLLIGLFANGHILLEGVPGLAKTLAVSSLAKVLKLDYKRIQFTPDLLPADLLGTLIFNQKSGNFEVKKGPIFSHIVLADEVNRSPAKVQSALLEAMQENQVTIGEQTYPLEQPFLVLATQNPIDQEGTYPLPEAQMDRFMMKVHVDYPNKEEEKQIMRLMARTSPKYQLTEVLGKDEIFEIRALVDEVQLSTKLEDYIIDIVDATRHPERYRLPQLAEFIDYGASPRASLALSLGARTHAFLEGRTYVLPEDIKAIAPDVLNHRIILSFEAEAEDTTTLDCIRQILKTVEI
jgi:MoxR-like ATPase